MKWLCVSTVYFRYLAEQGINPSKKLIKNATKIVYMEACGVGFKDSHSFLSMALKELPKSFELEELEKGHFPHFFNTSENQSYVGPWPDKKFYSPDSMKTDAATSSWPGTIPRRTRQVHSIF